MTHMSEEQRVRHLEVTQGPGDILYLPKGWWHCTYNLTEAHEYCVGIGGMGDSPGLHFPVAEGDIQACEDALHRRAGDGGKMEVLTERTNRGLTLLDTAVENNHVDVMDWIWEMYRTHVPDSSPFGAETSPLHHAAGCASKEALEWLLKKGVDVNAEDVHGTTPLHWAARSGCEATLNILLENGAVVNKVDNRGATALDLYSAEHHPLYT
mmetsp:Transcript_16582/g.31331  ORF Transcript_16582/g.31331 Transcript_16582/m.31331 type:complete len:210 (+) Transcript_16582:798-1427(+)